MASDADKVQLTKYPPLPSRCAICLFPSDGKREFIDFQLSFDYEGAVVICTECWLPVAERLGYAPQRILDDAARETQMALDMVERLQVENGQLRESLDTMSRFSIAPVSGNSGSDSFTIELVPAGPNARGTTFEGSGTDDRETT